VPNIKDLTYAGRLDKDSYGLVLLSNDGKFIYKALGSEFECEKEYIVRVNKSITADFIKYQSHGLITLDGKRVKKAIVRQINDYVYNIILTEGIYHQIKRMAENQGYRVVDLERVRIGNVRDPELAIGKWRYLNIAEISLFLKNN
jgi:23S rRNA pseudouridine2604 synthase